MESTEIVPALLIALVTVGLGFVVFAFFFDLSTLRVKSRFHGAGQRFGGWMRAHGRKVLLVLVIAAAVCVLGWAALRFAGPIAQRLGSLVSPQAAATRPEPEAIVAPPAQPAPPTPQPIVADHRGAAEVRLDRVSPADLELARQRLHILFVHGTHGSQISYGLKGLVSFKGPAYAGPDIEDIEFADRAEPDLGTWADQARTYLNAAGNHDVNVVLWLWSDELGRATEADVASYLAVTGELEAEFPEVCFVYATGHLDGGGLSGNVHLRNEQIRTWCRQNEKVLYDFADVESWDPDGAYYGDRAANDGCWYDSDGDGSLDRNWAKEWSAANPGAWYDCYSPHTFPLNANLKAYAAWWLWVELARKEAAHEGG